MQDPLVGWGSPQPLGDSLRLTRALAQDLRASVHGLRMALDMMAGRLEPGCRDGADRYLGMARAEAAQLDRLVEQIGLWVRLLGGDVRVRPRRLDVRLVAAERLGDQVEMVAEAPALVLADKDLLIPALDGLKDFLHAYTAHGEQAGVRIHPDGELELYGPAALLPVLRSVVEHPVPDLAVAKGPAMWLVGPALAVATCRACDGTVWLEAGATGCSLWLAWRLG